MRERENTPQASLSERIAAASGGFLGLGSKISPEEAAVMKRVASEIERAHDFARDVGADLFSVKSVSLYDSADPAHPALPDRRELRSLQYQGADGAARYAALAEDAQRILRVLSVICEPVGQQVLQKVLDALGWHDSRGLPLAQRMDRALRERSLWYRMGWRFRHFAAWERAVFDPAVATQVALASMTSCIRRVFRRFSAESSIHMWPPPPPQQKPLVPCRPSSTRLIPPMASRTFRGCL